MHTLNLQKKNPCQKAFTLLETLFAISIFTLSLVAITSVAGQGIINTRNASDEMIATYLNQEALEAVKWWRDDLRIQGLIPPSPGPGTPASLIGISFGLGGTTCGKIPAGPSPVLECNVIIDPTGSMSPAFYPCTRSTTGFCQHIYENNGVYYSTRSGAASYGGTLTPFTRKVTISVNPVGPGTNLKVVSDTMWIRKGIRYTNSMSTVLEGW